MKALLLKDWYVLRKQAWAYLIIVLVWGAIPSEVLNLLAVVYGAMIPYTAMEPLGQVCPDAPLFGPDCGA